MDQAVSVVGALTLRLSKDRTTAVSMFDLATMLWKLYSSRQYGGRRILSIRSAAPTRSSLFKYRDQLLENGIIESRPDLPAETYLLTMSPFKDPADIFCSLDPFSYISHLSALEHHGLTDIITKTLFVTTFPAAEWRQRALEKMKHELGNDIEAYQNAQLPMLQRHSVDTLGRSKLNISTSKSAGSYNVLSDRPMRVASIGRTFLDSLRRPDLCGGMSQVIEVFEGHAKSYLPLILDELDGHGDPIEKVRAGYILEERCEIRNNSRIDAWTALAQRGGSRKLDPAEAYWPEFSERWMISLNVSR